MLEKLGPIEVDKDDNPGPVNIRGNEVAIKLESVEKLEPSIVDIFCIVEYGDCREKTVLIVEYTDGNMVENEERLATRW